MRRALLTLAGVALLTLATPPGALAETTLEMVADRTEVPLGGRVLVEVRLKSDSLRGAEVDLPDFEGFSVLRQSVQRPMQFSFGLGGQQQVQSSTNYSFLLQADEVGSHVIPPAVARHRGTELKSRSLVIKVGDGASTNGKQPPGNPGQAQPSTTAPGPDADGEATTGPTEPARGNAIDVMQVDPQAFVRTVVDKGRPFEREQVTVSYYLYTRERLQEAPITDKEPTTDGFWTHQLGEPLQQLQPEQLGRARYRVYLLRRFAAFPLRSGELELGPMELTVRRPNSVFQIFGRGGGPKAPLSRRSAPVIIDVQPLPEQDQKNPKPPGDVAVGRYSVTAELDRTQVATGDAVTLTATVRGYGHLQSVRLADPSLKDVQVLQPQTKDLLEPQDGHIGGTRIYEWLLVPKQAGTVTIPAFEIPHFDPHAKRYNVARSVPLTLTAAGLDLSGAAAAVDPGPTQGAQGKDALGSDTTPLSWGPIRTDSDLLRARSATRHNALFWPGLLFPVLGFLGAVAWTTSRRMARQRGHRPEEVAMREAQQSLAEATGAADRGDAAAFFPAVSQALTRALEARLEEPVGGDTRAQLTKRLVQRGLPNEQATALMAQLTRCDEARFSPATADAADLRAAMSQAQTLFDAISRFTPTPAGRTPASTAEPQ